MPQLFQRRANAITKVVVLGGVLLFTGVCATLYAIGRSDYWTRVGQPLTQPVPFSHEHHVSGLGIDCRYCHTSVENSPFAGMPPTETCMTCHSQVWKEAPVLQPVRDSWQNDAPLRWNRVYDLPDYVYFDHSIHVKKGVGCASCHARIDKMPLTWMAQPLSMRWCLDCHRHPGKQIRPTGEVFNQLYVQPGNHAAQAPQLLARNQVRSEGLTDCYTCHR